MQAGRPGRYSFGEGRLPEDTAELPELEGAAAVRPGSPGPGPDQEQEQEPGRRGVGSFGTAAVAAVAVVGQAGGLRAGGCTLLRDRGKTFL